MPPGMSDSPPDARTVDGTVAVVTGANRGIGRALVEALLARGAARVYAGARDTSRLDPVVALDPDRVVALQLDVTEQDQIAAAAATASDATLLINNAGIAEFSTALDVPREVLHEMMAVNAYGPFDVIRAFVPALERN